MSLLRDHLSKKKVIVDERPVEVDEVISSSDIIQASGRSPSTYSLITADRNGGSQLIPSGRRIKVKDGQRFETNLNGVGG